MRLRWTLALVWVLIGAAAPFDPFGSATIEERPGAVIPTSLPLVTADGRAVTLGQLAAGKPLLLIPVLHQCPNFCGVTSTGFARSIAGQRYRAGHDFTVALFGIDPREGRAAAMTDLARLQKGGALEALGPPAALTGSAATIRATTYALGYRYAFDPRIGQYAHVAAAAVLTRDGRLSSWLYGIDPPPADLQRAIGAALLDRSGGLFDRIILLCYHYDPSTGTYTPAIERLLQLFALLTVVGLGALLFRGWRRQHG